MPLYDFQCQKCELLFEVERPLTATGPAKCPGCGSVKTSKVFSAAGIVFKGGGFYKNDSKAPPSSGVSKPEGKPIDKPARTDAGGGSEGAGKSSSTDPPKSTAKE